MTEDGPDDRASDDDRPDDGPDWQGNRPPAGDRESTPESWLSNLRSALERLEEFSRSGRRTGSTGLDYDVSIRSGLDDLGTGRGAGEPPGRGVDERSGPARGGSPGVGSSAPDRRRIRRPRRERTDYHVTTRTDEEEVLVTADLAGVDPDDVTVGFDERTLVVGVEGRALERVQVPWEDRTARAAVRNGILSVTVTPVTEGDSDD